MSSISALYKVIVIIVAFGLVCACSKRDGRAFIQRAGADDNVPVSSNIIESDTPSISEGNKAFLSGDLTAAIKFYQDGLNQNYSAACYNIGVSYYLLHNVSAAEQSFKDAIAADPSFDEAKINLISVLAEQGKYAEAEQYAGMVSDDNQSVISFVNLGNIALGSGESAKAAYYYQKALGIDNSSPYVVTNFANFLITIGEYDKGLELLTSMPTKDFQTTYNLAYLAWLQGDERGAYSTAQDAAIMDGGTSVGYLKLADLFYSMGKFNDEVDVLRKVVNWESRKDFRIKLILSNISAGKIEDASVEAQSLLDDFPKDPEVNAEYYKVQIAKGDIQAAGNFIEKAYEALPSDLLLYYCVRHISLYSRVTDAAYYMLNNKPSSDLVNLAWVAYYCGIADFSKAATALNNIKTPPLNDYYMFQSLLALKNGDYSTAQKAALKLDLRSPEYFWYNLASAWDMRDAKRVYEIFRMYQNNAIVSARVPATNYVAAPYFKGSDMFSFDNTGVDYASNLMYPLFIEPDEMYPFLVLGYRLLRSDERQAALQELTKSVALSDGIVANNKGTQHMLEFNYKEALAEFTKASETLSFSPFVYYNMGLAYYAMGNMSTAMEQFTLSIKYNEYFVPAYVGLGLVTMRDGRESDAMAFFDRAISAAGSFESGNVSGTALPMVTQAKYLAQLAMGDVDGILMDSTFDNSNFSQGVAALGRYMQSGQLASIKSLTEQPFYKSAELAYLINLYSFPPNGFIEQASDDIGTLLEAKYIAVKKLGTFTERYLERYMGDIEVLTSLANLSLLTDSPELCAEYLKRIADIDFSYPPQHKSAMLYYFLKGDSLNVEAAYRSLSRLDANNKESESLMLFSTLMTGNTLQLDMDLAGFNERFPGDVVGGFAAAAGLINEPNAKSFISAMMPIFNDDTMILTRVPLGVDFERF